ncbi:hypothetical protein WSM22_11850 [Cytophagales bacterium WSM2-2]|nr:hypothetical protein WSM22_11850 [Cytophagales bacterium WSM2-2]
MRPRLLLSVTIHLILTSICFTIGAGGYLWFGYAFSFGLALNFVGIVFIALGKRTRGVKFFVVGSIFFFPVGIVGMSGGHRIIDTEREIKAIK